MKLIATILFCAFLTNSFAQPGALDSDFSSDGKVTFSFFSNTPDTAYALQIQTDGKILVAGSSNNGSETVGAIARLDQYGNFDGSFGLNGTVVMDFPGVSESISFRAMALQPDDKIVVAGSYSSTLTKTFFVARFLPDGVIDTTFNSYGYQLTGFGSGQAKAFCVALQTDQKIVVGGTSFNSADNDFAIARYLPNGRPDSTFNGDGKLTTNGINGSATNDFVTALNILASGKIVAVGYSTPTVFFSHDLFSTIRYTPDGSLDLSYNTDGKFLFDAYGKKSKAFCSTMLADGKLLIAGTSNDSFAVAKITDNAVVDSTFGKDGIAIHSRGNYSLQQVNAIAVQPDGKIVVVGYVNDAGVPRFTVLRLKNNGLADSTFGNNGYVYHGFGSGTQNGIANAVVMQEDGRIVVAGFGNSNPDSEFALARYYSGLNLGVLNVHREQKSIRVYPNPVSDFVKLKYTLMQTETISIHLLDMQGRLVATLLENEMQEEGEMEKQFCLPDGISRGSYLLSVISEKGTESILIVKQ